MISSARAAMPRPAAWWPRHSTDGRAVRRRYLSSSFLSRHNAGIATAASGALIWWMAAADDTPDCRGPGPNRDIADQHVVCVLATYPEQRRRSAARQIPACYRCPLTARRSGRQGTNIHTDHVGRRGDHAHSDQGPIPKPRQDMTMAVATPAAMEVTSTPAPRNASVAAARPRVGRSGLKRNVPAMASMMPVSAFSVNHAATAQGPP